MSLVQEITDEVCDLFPAETKKYRGLIETCISDILENLPPGMNKGQYVQVVRENIQLVRDGKLE
jgi:hypothetical protein